LFVETRFYILIKTADKLQENEQNWKDAKLQSCR
jgi:hypothetical protein